MGADLGGGGGSEDFQSKRGKIAEKRTLADVNRRYFGVCSAGKSQLKKGSGSFTPNFECGDGEFQKDSPHYHRGQNYYKKPLYKNNF